MMNGIESIAIVGGRGKNGAPEASGICLKPGDLAAVVGPTGSGKSRLLADIEYIAQQDTPSGRRILINGEEPSDDVRFSWGKRLIAQLSQHMNFVMDATVEEFIRMHAESKGHDLAAACEQVVEQANLLTGEPITPDSPLTALSGGQSRALMIADTSLLSDSPVVLIDEIENAGIDRRKALEVLVKNQKIVLMATHDPVLALLADYRLILQNGGISRVLQTNDEERELLRKLQQVDERMMLIRSKLRLGEQLANSLF